MKVRLVIVLLLLTLVLIHNQALSAQDFESDEEAKEIRSRILDVSWTIEDRVVQTTEGDLNESRVQFKVDIELWNPYNFELVSYGSSSCRWVTHLETNFPSDVEIENSGVVCTTDYGPRKYPSGVSNETSYREIAFLNRNVTTDMIPNGNITITGQGGTFGNSSDPAFGVSIKFLNGTGIPTYQQTPSNWGEILYFTEESDALLDLDAPSGIIIISSSLMISYLRKFRNNK